MVSSLFVNELSLEVASTDPFAKSALDLLDQIGAGSLEPAFALDSSVRSIELSLEPGKLLLEDASGKVHQASFEGADATIASIAGSLPGLSIDPNQSALPWSAQVAVAGSSGNDSIDAASSAHSTVVQASGGSDRIAGSNALLNGVDYSSLVEHDQLSGLFLTNDPRQITLVANNLPPLLAEAFSDDALLVFKGDSAASVDLLEKIEVVRTGSADDQLRLTDQRSTPLFIDVAGGHDTATLVSALAPTIEALVSNQIKISWSIDSSNYLPGDLILKDLETLQWDSPSGLSTYQALSIASAFEDQPFLLNLGQLFPNTHLIQQISISSGPDGASPSWLQALVAEAGSQISDQLVIEATLLDGAQDAISLGQLSSLATGTEITIDLLVSDNRVAGEGLLGLQGDLNWNPAAATLLAVDLSDSLPLFRETSATQWQSGIATIAAAGLPPAGAGAPLGDQPQERFARLVFELIDPAAALNFSFDPTLFPAIGTSALTSDQVFTINLDRPLITQLQGMADQEMVGVNSLLLEASYTNGGRWQQRLDLTILNSNDAPIASGNSIDLVVLEDIPFTADLSVWFSDADAPFGDLLSYSLIQAPDWLSLDSATGELRGTPDNNDVGIFELTIEAQDLAGATARQSQQLTVLNVNDAPELGGPELLPQAQARQGDNFTYTLPEGSFVDPDVGDLLEYSLGVDAPDWLQIDASSGQITGKPSVDAPGSHSIEIIATDSSGATASRPLSVFVENVNDPPSLNPQALEAFRKSLGGSWILQQDQPLSLDPFSAGAWFSDPDGDTLTYTAELVLLGDDDEIAIASPSWLQVDAATGVIQANPGNAEVGDYRLVLKGSDQAGLQASASLQLQVQNINDAPLLNAIEASAFATRSLAEDAAFTITIPPALFQDSDSIYGDRLSYAVSQADGAPLPDWLHFDPLFGQLTGISSSPDAELELKITATDLSGASTSHLLQLQLPREAIAPHITTQVVTNREGEPLLLASALQVASADPDSEVVLVRVALGDVPEGFILQQLDPEAAPLPFAKDGVIELTSLDGVALVDASGDFAGDLQLAVQVISREINGHEVVVQANLQLQLAAVADPPRFSSTELDTTQLDPFQAPPAAAYATAAPTDSDGSELIDRYELTYINSAGRTSAADLLVMDANGNSLGSWEVLDLEGSDEKLWSLTLTSQEWAMAIVRSAERQVGEVVGFQAVAVSREVSNGDTARSAPLPLNLLVSPLVEAAELELLQSASRVRINDGSSSSASASFVLNLESAHAKDNLVLQVEVPPGTTLTAEKTQVTYLSEQVLLISADSFGSLAFDLLPPLDFSGLLKFSITPLATARSLAAAPFAALAADLAKGFAAFGETIAMELPVVPLAREPELTAFAFDAATGALSLTLQRGRNSRGEANGDEQLALAIAGVPSGYTLVMPANDAGLERRAGASDAIGSLVLFNVAGDLSNPDAPISFDLLLRSTANSSEQVSRIEQAELLVSASARLLPSEFLPIGHRSSSVSERLAISSWQGQLAQRQVDPLLIDLAGDGLNLVSLELSSVQFDLLNNGTPLPTAWLAPTNGLSQRDDAFLVMDRDGDGQINSISELVSEFFGSSGSVRSFATGVEALRSLDANADGVINNSDPAWNQLSLWFDDGDGITQVGELEGLTGWLSSINLAAQDLSPSAGSLLRQGEVILSSGAVASYYDVGLRYDPSGLPTQSLLELSAVMAKELKEAGEPAELLLSVPAFNVITAEDAARTLVRLSGVPAGSEPNLGVQDSGGDWVFTWAELQAQGSKLAIQSLDQRSGPATVQLLVSQITADGALRASAFTSLRLDVTPVATSPTLLLRKLRSQEDEPIQLSSLFVGGAATLNDRDGSEQLTYELSGLGSGMRLLRDGQELALELEPGGISYRLKDPLINLEGVSLIPTENLSGNISFQVTAMATEQANGDVFSITKNASLFLMAVVDPPILTIDEALLTLTQGSAISLTGVTGELVDRDGSEELLIELSGLPDWVTLRHDSLPGWRPRAQIKLSDGTSVVRVEAADLSAGELQLVDVISTGNKDDFTLSVAALAREKSNGLISVDQDTLQSEAKQLQVVYSSNAHQPTLFLTGELRTTEDSLDPISLADVLKVSLSQQARREQLLIRLTDLPSGLRLQDAAGHVLQPSASGAYELRSIDAVELVHTTPEASGILSFWFEVIAESLTGARSASSGLQRISMMVEAVADTPILTAPAQLTINSNDRVSFASISLASADKDGSERLSLEIRGLPGRSDNDPLEIAAADLQRLQLDFPYQLEDVVLTLRARSLEAGGGVQAEAWSEPQTLILLANAAAARPSLEVSGTLMGVEDTPVPLLAAEGGVITVGLEPGANQELSFRLYALPNGAVLLKYTNGSWEEISQENGEASLATLEGVAIRLAADSHGSASFRLDAIATAARSGDIKRTTADLQLMVTPVNDAPRNLAGSDLSLQEAQLFSLNLNERFYDPDDEVLNFNTSNTPLPSWISLDLKTGDLSFAPGNDDVTSENEPYVLEIIATDALGLSAKQSIKISVGNVNQAPITNIFAPSSCTTRQDQLLQIDLANLFTDPDQIHGDKLEYQVMSLPLWLSIDGENRLQGTPLNSDVGLENINIIAQDRAGMSASRSISIRVENVNDAPQLMEGFVSGETLRILEDEPFRLDLSGLFEDPDTIFGDSFTVNLTSKGSWPGWLQWDPETEVLSALRELGPANEDVGEYQLTWSAQDESFARASYRLNLIVENTNDAPVAKDLAGEQLVLEDSIYSIDLSSIFSDVDRGDSLRYEFVVRDSMGNPLGNQDWLSLRELEAAILSRQDVIAIEPLIKDLASGLVLDARQVAALPIGHKINLEVLVEDLRKNIERAGVTGLDLQVSWSSASLELDTSNEDILEDILKAGISAELSFGRLANITRQQDGVISLSASSAPFLGVGSEIGEAGPAVFATIPFRVKDPSKTILFDLAVRSDREGLNEITTLDNAANELRLEIGRFTTAQGHELVANPVNENVGKYIIELTATDDSGEFAVSDVILNVRNVNDDARLGDSIPTQFNLRDNRTFDLIDLSGVFVDDDLIHGDTFHYELVRGDFSENKDKISLEVIPNSQGSPIVKADISGLLNPYSEMVVVRATEIRAADQSAGKVLEVSFTLVVNPAADLIEIKRQDSVAQAEIEKNTAFKLFETLSLLPPIDFGDASDETYLYIESLPGLVFNGELLWDEAKVHQDSVVYRVKLRDDQIAKNLTVSEVLSSIEITPPLNQGYRMESGEIGLPIQIWTESFVLGDEDDGSYGSKYGVVTSKKLVTSVLLANEIPSVQPDARRSYSHVLSPVVDFNKPLFDLKKLFVDGDVPNGDELYYHIDIPLKLQDLIAFDNKTSQIKWSQNAELSPYVGSYRIQAWANDSSFKLGDQSSLAMANLYLNIRSKDGVKLSELFDSLRDVDNPDDLIPELKAIIGGNLSQEITSSTTFSASQLLARFPTIRDRVANPLTPSISDLISSFTRGQLGQLDPLLDPLDVNSGLILVSDSSFEVSHLSIERLNDSDIEGLGVLTSDLISYGPKLGFEVETGGFPYAIVSIEMPANMDSFDSILKTRFVDRDGDGIAETEQAYNFHVVSGLRTANDFAVSDFVIFDYSPLVDERESIPLQYDLKAFLDNIHLNKRNFDGSAFLFDLDGDGKPDVIRMLLLDNGFFDNDVQDGIINDPLIPVRLSTLANLPPFATSEPFNPTPETGLRVEDIQFSGDVIRTIPGNTSSDIIITAPSFATNELSNLSPETGLGVEDIQSSSVSASPNPPAFGQNMLKIPSFRLDPFHQRSEQAIVSTPNTHSDRGLGIGRQPDQWFASGTQPLEIFEPFTEQTIVPREVNLRNGFKLRLNSLTHDLSDALGALADQIRDGINSAGIGGFLLVALVAPASIRSASQLLIKQDSQKLKLRKTAITPVQPMCVRLIDTRDDGHSSDLRYVDGLLIVETIPIQDGAYSNEKVMLCEGNLELLIASTDQPGLALRALEDVLLRLTRTPIDPVGSYHWDSWLSAMLEQHRPTSLRLAKDASVAKWRLEARLGEAEKFSPMLSSLYMGAEVLHCYRCLGGRWPV